MLHYGTDAHPGGTIFFLWEEQLGVHRTKRFCNEKMLLKVAPENVLLFVVTSYGCCNSYRERQAAITANLLCTHARTSAAEGLRWLQAKDSRAGRGLRRAGDAAPLQRCRRAAPAAAPARGSPSERWEPCCSLSAGLLCRQEIKSDFRSSFHFSCCGFKEKLLTEVIFLKSWHKYYSLLCTELVLSGYSEPDKLCS